MTVDHSETEAVQAGCSGLVLLLFGETVMRRPLFAVLAGIVAAIRITVMLFPWEPPDYESFRGNTSCLLGTVCGLEPKQEGDGIVWRMMLSDVKVEGNSSKTPAFGRHERVLCVLDREPSSALKMSARVRVQGKITPFDRACNEGEFDTGLYYHILRVPFSLRKARVLAVSAPTDLPASVLYDVKRQISALIDRQFSAENAPVVRALLLGEKGLLEEETKELYQGAGVLHILSISGLHMSLLGMGFFSLLGKMPGKIRLPLSVRAAASVIVLFLYGKMTGMGTSTVRALVMLSLFITSKVVRRTYDLITAAGIAAVLLLLDQPLYLLHTGFLFSFSAVLSIGILAPALPGKAMKILAIPLGTLPVYLWTYGTFPVCSLLMNPVVIPLLPVVMASAVLAVLTGGGLQTAGAEAAGVSGLSSLGKMFALPAEGILDLYKKLALLSQKVPVHEIVPGRPAVWQTVLYYGILLALAAVSAYLQMPHTRRHMTMPHWSGPGTPARRHMTMPHWSGPGTPARRRTTKPHWSGPGTVPETVPGAVPDTVPEKGGRLLLFIRKLLNPGEAALPAAVFLCKRFHVRDNRERRRLASVCAAVCLCLAVLVLTFRIPPRFEMDFLYVGQGDGIFLTCEGRNFLIDGGSSTRNGLSEYVLLPFLHSRGISRLDGVFLSHDDSDHCSGLLELLEAASSGTPKLRIGRLYLPDLAETAKGENYRKIEELSRQTGIPVTYISRGQRVRSGKLTLDCLHPACGAAYEDVNESSAVFLVRYEGFSALLTGDLEGRGEEDFLKTMERTREKSVKGTTDRPGEKDPAGEKDTPGKLPLQVLKVAHHGSRNATGEEFLKKIEPGIAVISAGKRNRYGHPNEELLKRLSAYMDQDAVFRTDRGGEIMIRLKKEKITVNTFSDCGMYLRTAVSINNDAYCENSVDER